MNLFLLVAPAFNRLIVDYHLTLGLLLVLSVLLLWKLTKFVELYKQFPSYTLTPLLLLIAALLGKVPKNLPITGFVFQKAVLFSKRCQKEGVCLFWLPRPHLLLFGEEAVKIFSKEQAALDKSYKYEVLRDSFGSGLVTSNGENWRLHRKMLNPVFHVGMLKNKMPIFNENAKTLVENLQEAVNETSIDVLELIKPCTFGVLCEYVLGLKMNIPENKEMLKNYIKLVTSLTELMVHCFFQPWLRFKFIRKYLHTAREYSNVIEGIDNFAMEIISVMKKNILSQQVDRQSGGCDWNDDSDTRKSFANILLDHHLKDNSLTVDDVKYQITTFMDAGFDTVSYALLWNLFMLGHHPDVQEQAYNEVDALPDSSIKYEDLYKLKYLECVIKETLRLYPPVPLYARKLHKDTQCGKYNVPKGTDIVFFPYMFHRNPGMYPDPETFKPDRFLDSTMEKNFGNHISFSEGIRNCIGKRFAMMEMKVILAYILRNFRIISLDRKEDVDLCWNIVLGPAKPLLFHFTPRK